MDKKPFKIVELIIDDENEEMSIDAISLVTEPAIMVDFLYFSKKKHKSNVCLAKLDEEKQMLISPALIPNKQIFRYNEEEQQEYYYNENSMHNYIKNDTCSDWFNMHGPNKYPELKPEMDPFLKQVKFHNKIIGFKTTSKFNGISSGVERWFY